MTIPGQTYASAVRSGGGGCGGAGCGPHLPHELRDVATVDGYLPATHEFAFQEGLLDPIGSPGSGIAFGLLGPALKALGAGLAGKAAEEVWDALAPGQARCKCQILIRGDGKKNADGSFLTINLLYTVDTLIGCFDSPFGGAGSGAETCRPHCLDASYLFEDQCASFNADPTQVPPFGGPLPGAPYYRVNQNEAPQGFLHGVDGQGRSTPAIPMGPMTPTSSRHRKTLSMFSNWRVVKVVPLCS